MSRRVLALIAILALALAVLTGLAVRRGVLPPLHKILVRDLGVTMMELLHLREPAEDGVETGMLVVAPLRISRGVGSPVNPLLVA